MSFFYSVEINGIHMLKTYGMALSNTYCVQPPEVKQHTVDLPGRNGQIDMSEYLTGYPLYGNRKIIMNFGAGAPKNAWSSIYSDILKNFHNKNVRVVFDDDRGYYYSGRAGVSSYQRFQTLGTFTIIVDAAPYKLELLSGLDRWLWDPFSFKSGVIRGYKDIKVSGEKSIIIPGTGMPVIPVISVNTDMQVRFNGKTYPLRAGKNKVYEITILEGAHTLTFTGTGTVSIDYRGGLL